MTHPEELLAGYVDGTLTAEERAVVDAHLSACPTCREEVDLAAAAAAALAALPDEPVPFGVMSPVWTELRRREERRARRSLPIRPQWVAGAAAAAAIVALVVVSLPRLTERGEETAVPADTTAPALEAAPAPSGLKAAGLEIQDVDYDAATLETLAAEVAERSRGDEVATDTADFGAGQDAAVALECVMQGSSLTPNDQLVRLIQASFEGTPAYIGVFLESPGAGRPPAQVLIWVVAKADCSILSFASKQI